MRKYVSIVFLLISMFCVPPTQAGDLLGIPYFKIVAEAWRDNNYTLYNLWSDGFTLNNCQKNIVPCLKGINAGLTSIDTNKKIVHKSEKIKATEKIVSELGAFQVVEFDEPAMLLNSSQKQIFEISQRDELTQIDLWKKIILTQRDIDQIQNYINTQASKKELYGPLFTSWFMNEYKRTSDPFASIIPYDLASRLASLPDEGSVQAGLTLTNINGRLMVKAITLDSPAFWAGVRYMDEVIAFNGQKIDKVTTSEFSRSIDAKIFAIDILRAGEKQTLAIPLVELSLKKAEFSLVQWRSRNIIRMKLRTFDADLSLCTYISKQIEVFKHRYSVQGIVLDLRDNGGGSVYFGSCLNMIFLGGDKLLMNRVDLDTKQATPINTWHQPIAEASGIKVDQSIPLAILINGKSASMSEATAGALRDYARAWSIGQRTFGKGSINGGSPSSISEKFLEYKTVALFYQPNQTTNELVGIIPDFTVPSRYKTTADEDFVKRNEDLNPELPFKRNEATLPPRQNRIAEIERCVDKQDLIKRSEEAVGKSVALDYQFFYALEVLRCDTMSASR
ncbi:MAG: hypothetical protein JNL11_08615 [Bdellovibrionaceae bacterium]|nr:hypothetical protein [Pseudobdellovibrionaceae bacterium]